MRVIFFGTPGCAVPYLQAIREAGGEVVGVITQPDRPRGRSKALCPPPVKEAAEALQCCILQPGDCRDEDFLQQLRDLEPDMLLVVAYGRILCRNLLVIPKVAALNVHYSLLPAFRGAAPVQRALLAGLDETGVTLQHVAWELDSGDIVAQATVTVRDEDDTESLMARLTEAGVELVKQWLPPVMAATAPRMAQDHGQATLAPRLEKRDGIVDWKRAAREITNQVRAVTPWPGAVATLKGKQLLLRRVRVAEVAEEGEPGEVIELPQGEEGGLVVKAGSGAVELLTVQPEGRKAMTAGEYVRGARLGCGDGFDVA